MIELLVGILIIALVISWPPILLITAAWLLGHLIMDLFKGGPGW